MSTGRRLALIAIGSALVAVVVTGVYFSVRAVYGAFEPAYYLTVDLSRAGMQLHPGSQVRTKGVAIGEVARISLVDRHARLQLKIKDEYKIPEEAVARVELKTPLGAKYVDLEFPPGAGGPHLADGDEIERGFVGPELEDLLADGTRVLEAIPPDDAGTIIGELAAGSRSHGDDIARGLEANSELALLFARTLDPQLEAIGDFEKIFGALESRGVDLNLLADAVNEGAPVFASARAQQNLRRALEALVPFGDDLADLLILQKEDFDRMQDEGDKVLATIAAHPGGLRDLVHGLYRYVYKLGQPIGDFFMVEDGSAGAGFTAFIGGNDQEEDAEQICAVFPPEFRPHVPACEGRP